MPRRRTTGSTGATASESGLDHASGPLAGLSEEALRATVPEPIVGRGARYAAAGAVEAVALRGRVLDAAVQGSEERPYHVTAHRVPRGRSAGALVSACTCPYMEGAASDDQATWCKHVVAALLVALADPQAVARQPPVSALVEPLDRAALVRLQEAVLARAPDLYAIVAEEATRVARVRRR